MKKLPLIMGLVIALMFALTTLSLAQTINACYSNNNGALRIVSNASQCKKSETFISWAQVNGITAALLGWFMSDSLIFPPTYYTSPNITLTDCGVVTQTVTFKQYHYYWFKLLENPFTFTQIPTCVATIELSGWLDVNAAIVSVNSLGATNQCPNFPPDLGTSIYLQFIIPEPLACSYGPEYCTNDVVVNFACFQ